MAVWAYMHMLYRPTAQLKIALTGRCTNDCAICFNDTRRRDNHLRSDLPFDTLRDTVDQAAAMGLSGVYWTGGEPFLRYADLVALTRHASKLGLSTSVVTNAGPLGGVAEYKNKNEALFRQAGVWSLSPNDMVQELRDAGLTRVFISVDNSHNTDQSPHQAPANRVPTVVVANAVSALLDAGFGAPHEKAYLGDRLRISVTGNGAWRTPSERMLADVLRRVGLKADAPDGDGAEPQQAGAHPSVRRYSDRRGTVAVKYLETAQVGAALVLPERLLEKRRARQLFEIRCGNMTRREDAYDGGEHHQDLSVNHEGTVSLCGNFMYPIGDIHESALGDLVESVNRGSGEGAFAGSVAVLHRLFWLAEVEGFGAAAIGEAFRILNDEDPACISGIATEGGACHALGRDPSLQERFVAAFDRRFPRASVASAR